MAGLKGRTILAKQLDVIAIRQEVLKAVEKAKAQIKFGKWDNPAVPNFPTMCSCPVCGGYTAAHRASNDPLVATIIALIQHGYYIKAWEDEEVNCLNRDNFPKPCICECKHEFEEESVGKCMHKWKCKKCGVSQVVDSSD